MKNLFKSMPRFPSFSMWSIFAILCMPFFLISLLGFYFFHKQAQLQELEERLMLVSERAAKIRKKELINEALQERHKKSDPHYLTNQIENFTPLAQEKTQLEQKLNSRWPGLEILETRLGQLKEKNLKFVEKVNLCKEGLQESVHIARPIELDSRDLYELLTLIEEPKRQAPLFLITELTLNRKHSIGKNEVFEMQLELLKREFL